MIAEQQRDPTVEEVASRLRAQAETHYRSRRDRARLL
jgi:hypothetical protein